MGKCNSKNTNMPEKNNVYKILSYNVRLMFDSPLRAKNIAYFLLTRYESNYDIICLQGIYNNSKKEIIDILKNTYPYIEPTNDKIGFLIFSKYNIMNYKFIKYNINNKIECDGYIYINILINEKIITIYNVIFQSDYKTLILNEKTRLNQINEIKKYMINDDSNYTFIIGSLNIKGKNTTNKTNEYNYLINNFNDLFNYKKNQIIYTDNRNDYILLHNNKQIKILKMSFIDIDYSDHYPLELFFC